MTPIIMKRTAASLLILSVMGLSACQSGGGSGGAPTVTTPNGGSGAGSSGGSRRNTGDNVARSSSSGATVSSGFGTVSFPDTRSGAETARTSFADASDLRARPLGGVAARSAVRVLTLDTTSNIVRDAAALYTSASNTLTRDGKSYKVASGGKDFTGAVISGGDNLVVVAPTDRADMPLSGAARFTGKGDVLYVNAPSSQVFSGKMTGRVTANFGTDRVDIDLTRPRGQIAGRAYSGPGRIDIDGLRISGNSYRSVSGSTASVTGFKGASDLNSGRQRLSARGVFGGAGAQETGAVARISDGGNGQAIVRLTADR